MSRYRSLAIAFAGATVLVLAALFLTGGKPSPAGEDGRSAAEAGDDASPDKVARVYDHIREKRFDEAEALLSEVEGVQPSFIELLRGDILRAREDYDAALQCYRKALSSDIGEAHVGYAYQSIAMTFVSLGDDAAAEENFRKAIAAADASPDAKWIYSQYSKFRLKKQTVTPEDVEVANTYAKKAFDLDPRNPGIKNWLQVVESIREDPAAFEEWKRKKEESPAEKASRKRKG